MARTYVRRSAQPMKQIKAKFPSTCGQCKGKIEEGETIMWAPGRVARHPLCEPKAPDLRVLRRVDNRLAQIQAREAKKGE